MLLLVINLSDQEDPSIPPITTYIIDKLQHEATLPVFLSLARLYSEQAPTQSPIIALECIRSDLAASNSLQALDCLYERWIFIPCPPSLQLTQIEQQIRLIPDIERIHYSIQILHLNRSLCLPLSFPSCWYTLSTLKRHCTTWSNAISWLCVSAGLDSRLSHLSHECMQQITSVPKGSRGKRLRSGRQLQARIYFPRTLYSNS
jgi:hypothetical protein